MENGIYNLPKKAWPAPYAVLADAIYELRRRVSSPLLLASSIANPRHSIPREHLELLSEIEHNRPVRVPFPFTILVRWSACLMAASLDTALLVLLRIVFSDGGSRWSERRFDVILKTWVPGPDALKRPSDFYYGTLWNEIEQKGRRALLLAGDGRSDDGSVSGKLKALLRPWKIVGGALQSDRYFPEQLLVPLWAPLATSFRQLVLGLRLAARVGDEMDPVLKRVTARAALDVVRPYTGKNFQHRFIAERAVRRWKPKAVVTFFEGQPWEKLFWSGARAADPSITIAGYQHTVIMPHSFALLRPFTNENEIAVPDVVLCTGETTRAMLARALGSFPTRLLTFGTHRRGEKEPAPAPPRPAQKTILVLPEGILTEATVLFNCAMELAAALPDHRFIFRCHPVLPYEKVAPHLKQGAKKFSNVKISTEPLIANDFARASALLYRGSSAVLYAVLAGLKPICWREYGLPNADPLFAVNGWRSYAENVGDVGRALTDYESAERRTNEHAWSDAAGIVNTMVQPVSDASIEVFLKEVLSR